MPRLASAAVLLAALGLSACAGTSAVRPNGWAAPPADARAERAPSRDDARREAARPAATTPPATERTVPPHRAERLENRPPVRATRAERRPATASGLVLPVVGIEGDELRDSFHAPRSGGRTHHAIDIGAPTGTPLVAVTDGTITRKHWNRLGGNTLYLTSADGRTDFYYAHLDAYADGIEIGTRVRRGDVIGTVGATGNARGPHLHFQVLDKRGQGRGTPVNPYDLLRTAELAAAE